MKLPFQKAKLASYRRLCAVHVESKTLRTSCPPPASTWIKVVGFCAPHSPLPASPSSCQRNTEVPAACQVERNPAYTVSGSPGWTWRQSCQGCTDAPVQMGSPSASPALPACSWRRRTETRILRGCRKGPPQTRQDPCCLASVPRTSLTNPLWVESICRNWRINSPSGLAANGRDSGSSGRAGAVQTQAVCQERLLQPPRLPTSQP